jgi:hypothetical protein
MHLDVSDNKFGGAIPTSHGELSLLEFLFLPVNEFDANVIPDLFANLLLVEERSLGGTNRVGALPEWIADFEDLRLLDLGSNALTGLVPEIYNQLQNLEYLLLNNNPDIFSTNSVVPSFEQHSWMALW